MTQVTTHCGSDTHEQIENGHSLLDLARGWLGQGNTTVSMELLKSGLDSPQADDDSILRASIIKETGRAHMMNSSWSEAEFHFKEAQHLYKSKADLKGAAECARNRGNMWFQRGDFAKSEDLCAEALDLANQVGDPALRATILNTMGAIKSATGDFPEAIRVLRLCLADFEASGNRARQGYVLLNIGLTHVETGELVPALDALKKALALALEVKDLTLVEISYQNIAKCYLVQKQPKLAQSAAEFARKILPGLSSKALEAELSLIEGRTMRLCGDFDRTRSKLRDALGLATANSMAALEADVLLEQGLLEQDCGNETVAVTKFDVAMQAYSHIGHNKGVQETVRLIDMAKRRAT